MSQPKRPSQKPPIDEAERLNAVRNVCDLYEEAQQRYRILPINPQLGEQFTFDDNYQAVVHNWFFFKEAFSHRLVENLLGEYDLVRHELRGGLVVDGFSGAGTTVLTAAMMGHRAVGTEVNPFLTWVANTKLAWPKVDVPLAHRLAMAVIKKGATVLLTDGDRPELSTFGKFFDTDVLDRLLRLRKALKQEAERLPCDPETQREVRDFLMLGLVAVVGDGSHLIKKGRGLKQRGKTYQMPDAEALTERLHRWWFHHLHLIEETRDQYKGAMLPAEVRNEQAFSTSIKDRSAWISICSPPYCNCFDYSEVYKLELFFSEQVTTYEDWGNLRKRTVRSHPAVKFDRPYRSDLDQLPPAIGYLTRYLSAVRKSTWADFGEMVHGYFDDMGATLMEQARYLKPGGISVIVVGNSSYLGVPVATDMLLAQIAESTGFFTVEEIRPGRLMLTASQQWDQVKDTPVRDYLRESAIVLRRNEHPFPQRNSGRRNS